MGEMVRRRTVETRDDLSAQERQIVQLVCEGLSNPAIGARLFLSPRTEEWHLHKVYDKVGVRSRRELAPALPTGQARKTLISPWRPPKPPLRNARTWSPNCSGYWSRKPCPESA